MKIISEEKTVRLEIEHSNTSPDGFGEVLNNLDDRFGKNNYMVLRKYSKTRDTSIVIILAADAA